MFLPNGRRCLECGDDFQETNHIRSVSKCAKCKYQSACSRAILDHISNCNGESNLDAMISCSLGAEMFCICGYSSSEGNFYYFFHLVTSKTDKNGSYNLMLLDVLPCGYTKDYTESNE